jgi:hypothetical protein
MSSTALRALGSGSEWEWRMSIELMAGGTVDRRAD